MQTVPEESRFHQCLKKLDYYRPYYLSRWVEHSEESEKMILEEFHQQIAVEERMMIEEERPQIMEISYNKI